MLSVALLAALALLAPALAVPAPALPAPAEAAVRNAVDDALAQLRDIILNGDAELGIPVLDPLEVDNFNFDVNEGPALDVEGSLSNARVDGAGAFVVEKSKISIGIIPPRATVTVAVRVPVINAVGDYSLSGQGELDGQEVPLNAEGDFTVVIKDIRFEVKAVVTLTYTVRSVDVTLGLGDVSIDVQGAGAVGDAINAEAAARIQEWFAANRSDLEKKAGEILKDVIQQALSKRSLLL